MPRTTAHAKMLALAALPEQSQPLPALRRRRRGERADESVELLKVDVAFWVVLVIYLSNDFFYFLKSGRLAEKLKACL